jgi:hypothetical protein
VGVGLGCRICGINWKVSSSRRNYRSC